MSRLFFVHIPKNAGTSVKKWGEDNSIGFMEYKHKELKNLHDRFPNHTDCKSFAIIRNTYERMVSYYMYSKNLKRRIPSDLTKVAAFGPVEWLDFAIKNKKDVSWSQTRWIDGVDHVLRYENLQEDFKIIQELTGCYEPLPFENVSKRQEEKANLYNNNEFMTLIETQFKKEIEYFNYNRPDGVIK